MHKGGIIDGSDLPNPDLSNLYDTVSVGGLKYMKVKQSTIDELHAFTQEWHARYMDQL